MDNLPPFFMEGVFFTHPPFGCHRFIFFSETMP